VSEAPARVLEALRHAGDDSTSGAALSSDLGVSRAQVWKHVETLRARGYAIDGERGGGYRLRAAPDRLYPEEIQHGLDTRWMAKSLHYFDRTDSTNREALERARDGAAHGTAVIAEGQTAGRGRLGRSFYSPAYVNLYTSIVLRPRLDTSAAPTLILASAIGVAEAVAEEVGDSERVEIKWPNDVLIDGLKTSGILVELGVEATRVTFCVLGVGVNLNVDPSEFPEEFRGRATSLSAACGRPIDRAAFTRRLYRALEDVLDAHAEGGFDAIRPRFASFFRMTGSRVRVRDLDGSEIEGRVDGVDPDGALRLERQDGTPERVLAGDVTIVKEGQA
jgi:BirA family biotin operon repressor/biotin-[acetyl-CoA-carboxylase] ligase